MKEENSAATTSSMKRTQSSEIGHPYPCGGKGGGYKFWALAAILLLAFWSMFTGSVTLKWSASNLSRFSDGLDSPILDDLDVLEVEEREKLVRYMWDLYTHTTTTRLPRFWEEAFEAAYMDLASDVPSLRNSAVSEIAKMSLRSLHLNPISLRSNDRRETRKNVMKQAEVGKEISGVKSK